MYLSFYELKTEPFKISTDPAFLWLGEKHKEALATLRYGILGNKGILLLTGDVGTGKTTLIHTLLNSLGDDTIVATVPDPGLDKMDFFNYVANAFNIKKTFYSKGEFILYLTHFLKSAYGDKKKVLLIIDEAQRLNKDMLEEIRLLSNIELQHTKLINLFFVGQKEFNDIISLEENKALRQRITLRYNIEPLNLNETQEYIKHRLQVAGTAKTIFTPSAISELFASSHGYPRLINVISDFALLTGFVKEKKLIDAPIVRECAQELKIPSKAANQGVQRQVVFEKEINKTDISWQPYALAPEKEPETVEPRVETPVSSPVPTSLGLAPPEGRKPRSYKWGIIILIILSLLTLGYYFLPLSGNALHRAKNLWGKMQGAIPQNQAEPEDRDTKPRENQSVTTVDKEEEIKDFPIPVVPVEKKVPEKPVADKTTNAMPSSPVAPRVINDGEKPLLGHASSDLIPIPAGGVGKNTGIPVPDPQPPPTTNPLPRSDKSPKPEPDMQQAAQAAKTSGTAITEGEDKDAILIYFGSNSFSLTNESIGKLDKIIQRLARMPNAELVIRGYTDDTGPLVYNERLSVFRAFSVKSYLVENGIDPSKARAFGMGPRTPYDAKGNRIPYQLTRTVEVEIVKGKLPE